MQTCYFVGNKVVSKKIKVARATQPPGSVGTWCSKCGEPSSGSVCDNCVEGDDNGQVKTSGFCDSLFQMK